MKSVVSGKTKSVIIGSAVAVTAAVGIALAGPATADKSYNVMLTDVPPIAVSIGMTVGPQGDDNKPQRVQTCFRGTMGKDIDTHIKAMAGERVRTRVYLTLDCKTPLGPTIVGESQEQKPVPPNLTTDNYWFKVGPTRNVVENGQ
jgi:hypothetical protein